MQKTDLTPRQLFNKVGIPFVEKLDQNTPFHYVVPCLFLILFEKFGKGELFTTTHNGVSECIAFPIDTDLKSNGIDGWFVCYSRHGKEYDFVIEFYYKYELHAPESSIPDGFISPPPFSVFAWYAKEKNSPRAVTKPEEWGQHVAACFKHNGPFFSGHFGTIGDREENDQDSIRYTTNLFLLRVLHEQMKPLRSWIQDRARSFTVAAATKKVG